MSFDLPYAMAKVRILCLPPNFLQEKQRCRRRKNAFPPQNGIRNSQHGGKQHEPAENYIGHKKNYMGRRKNYIRHNPNYIRHNFRRYKPLDNSNL